MPSDYLILEVIMFGAVLWLGLYVIQRDLHNPVLRLAGTGIAAYALGLALLAFTRFVPMDAAGNNLTKVGWVCLLLPAFCWTGALVYRLPPEFAWQALAVRIWQYLLVPLTAFYFLLAITTELVIDPVSAKPRDAWAYLGAFVIVLLPLFIAANLTVIYWRNRTDAPAKPLGLLAMGILFFFLSTALFISPLSVLPRLWVLLLLGVDLLLLGLAIGLLDAFEQGEKFLPDFVRSFVFTAAVAVLFGGQVGLIMVISTGVTFGMLVLLMTVIVTAISVEVFATRLGTWLDKFALAGFPRLRQTRQELKETADALPRQAYNENLGFAEMDEAEFSRLTRRAISFLGDLPRLATSPLVRLPLVEVRLQKRGIILQGGEEVLERASELKLLLAECIEKLKPRSSEFGTSDEWRFYNALYFPYVVGLKPYSQRANNYSSHAPDKISKLALEWFRTDVPERTLYNWQNAAAKLVAKELWQANQLILHPSLTRETVNLKN
jgi:hypothetical protein